MNTTENFQIIRQYLARQHVFTLCTTTENDIWCASCFYVFDAEKIAFWFMTESHTRHGEMMQINSQVAGTVAGQIRNIAQIKGIQFKGSVICLAGEEDKAARARYCRRFPVAMAAKTPVWQLDLSEIKMTDNSLGFGKKICWQR
ncbi:YhbP family protein [Photorhabdus tasmaniensis]